MKFDILYVLLGDDDRRHYLGAYSEMMQFDNVMKTATIEKKKDIFSSADAQR